MTAFLDGARPEVLVYVGFLVGLLTAFLVAVAALPWDPDPPPGGLELEDDHDDP